MRLKEAKKWIKWVNDRLPEGYPFNARVKDAQLASSLERAKAIKCATDSRETIRTYSSVLKIFLEWLDDNQMKNILSTRFSSVHAQRFMNYCLIDRKLNNNSWNGYLRIIKGLFEELKSGGVILENPFREIKYRKKSAKRRRAFNEQEKSIVANYSYQNDPFLFTCIILQYHCFVRPGECLKLKGQHFNFEDQLIFMPGANTKNGETGIITIPDKVIPLLLDLGIHRIPSNFFVFGRGGQPHARKSVGYNNLRNRHKKILQLLHKDGTLTDIEGLELYSWKDTGALELFRQKVNMLEIMKQLRHKDLNTTQKYCQSLYYINQEIKVRSSPLIVLGNE